MCKDYSRMKILRVSLVSNSRILPQRVFDWLLKVELRKWLLAHKWYESSISEMKPMKQTAKNLFKFFRVSKSFKFYLSDYKFLYELLKIIIAIINNVQVMQYE